MLNKSNDHIDQDPGCTRESVGEATAKSESLAISLHRDLTLKMDAFPVWSGVLVLL